MLFGPSETAPDHMLFRWTTPCVRMRFARNRSLADLSRPPDRTGRSPARFLVRGTRRNTSRRSRAALTSRLRPPKPRNKPGSAGCPASRNNSDFGNTTPCACCIATTTAYRGLGDWRVPEPTSTEACLFVSLSTTKPDPAHMGLRRVMRGSLGNW